MATPDSANAQVYPVSPPERDNTIEFNATLDITANMAGKASSFLSNEIPPTYRDPHILIHEANFIVFAPVDEDLSVEMRLRADSRGSGALHSPALALAVLNYTPVDRPWSVSAGRFVTPFGLHPARQLQVQRTFIANPLAWGYFLPISDRMGYAPGMTQGVYGEDDVGMTTLGFDGLSSGIRYDWSDPDGRALHIALANATPCAPSEWTDQFNGALIGRYEWQASDELTQGLSLSWGSFMQQDYDIDPFLRNPPQYRQLALGTDWTWIRGIFTLQGELIASQWKVPRFADSTFAADPAKPLVPYTVKPTLATGYLDTRVDLPTRTFSYVAARIETMQFLPMNDPLASSKHDWARSVVRWTVGGGFNLTHSLRIKASFSNQMLRNEPKPVSDWAFRLMATVVF